MPNSGIEAIIFLSGLWILYVLIHSLLAAQRPKALLDRVWPSALPYYRFCYNLFATLTLALVFWYQVSIKVHRFYEPGLALFMSGSAILTGGFVIVFASFQSYPFSEFAGVDVFWGRRIQSNGALIIKGLSKKVRHPLYLGVFCISWGLFLARPYAAHLTMATIFTLYIYVGLGLEEKKLAGEFGRSYLDYKEKTPFLFPRIFRKK